MIETNWLLHKNICSNEQSIEKRCAFIMCKAQLKKNYIKSRLKSNMETNCQ